MERLVTTLTPLTKPLHHAVPYMSQDYRALNRNIALICFSQSMRDRAAGRG